MMSNEINLEELEALANAAGGVKWIACGPSYGEAKPAFLDEVNVDDDEHPESVCQYPAGCRSDVSDKMAYIAEANPATLLSLLDRLKSAEAERDADGPWKNAVIEQLVVAHILTAEHESDPLKAVQDLLAYHADIAVDPRVSGAAAGLVERTKEACAKACMDEARKWPYPSRGNAAASMCAKMIFDMRQK